MIMLGMSSRTAAILSDSFQYKCASMCRESSLSGRASALLKPRAMLMSAIMLRRILSEIFASSRVAGREQGRTNRQGQGQDKSRKVRPVGRLGNVSNLNHAPNIAKDRRNLRVSPWRCSCS
ncbi:MAG: hypothetical protein AB7I42_29665, partial [Bradyrhizobium sp.]|uniref:hypothetical protein n=1 Tax=Bradyrhizobium sp. TaxID=376 RepID=UPI003D0CC15A